MVVILLRSHETKKKKLKCTGTKYKGKTYMLKQLTLILN